MKFRFQASKILNIQMTKQENKNQKSLQILTFSKILVKFSR